MRAYELLPAVHRLRDAAERDHPLRSLLAVVELELERLRADVDQLYDDWFIETCAEWVVPYLGDLLGVQGLAAVPGGVATDRALVANTIGYRRRKGTAAMLEQLARDVTGWPARAVEYFQLLGTTQHLVHLRPSQVRTPDLRDAGRWELLGTPFDTTGHTADVRHIDVRRGKHNLPHLGLHLWRLAAYPLEDADAFPVDPARGKWRFDPAGRDLPLFSRPRTETEPTGLATETDVPAPLRRRALHEELTALRATGREPLLLGGREPALLVGLPDPVPPDRLICCDLTDWRRPPGGPDDVTVAVDPVLGRLTLPEGVEPARVRVDFGYGFPGDLGAGPFDRRAVLADALALAGTPWPEVADWQIGVSQRLDPAPGEIVGSLTEAVQAWHDRPDPAPGQVGVIAVLDSATYVEDLTGAARIRVPPGCRLLLVAASWPQRDDPAGGGGKVRSPGSFAASGLRPHLAGGIEVVGEPGPAASGSELVISGLSMAGGVTAAPGALASLVLANCTLVGDGGMVAAAGNDQLTVRLMRSVCAGVRLAAGAQLGLTDCLLHAGGEVDALAVEAAGAHVEIEACTLLGRTIARTLAASNSILRGHCRVASRQEGCVRFSFLPPDSRVPRRYRCQPAEGAARAVAPRFTSIRPADPGFGQLAPDCPVEITTGADDEGEMGAYHFLQQHRRVANLVSQLDTYLRFGLEAGVFFVT